jgi:sn-glycerol 3-phosphate transport system permease protein
VVNLVYAFFETFAIIHAVTSGGPERDRDPGLQGLPRRRKARPRRLLGAVGGLMLRVTALTVAQFRYVERRVQYQ